ncbi:putative Heterokaryon incompatibility domain-containing protein [Seiridium unicorne]|uniref:Heterokaryon incompatibility domain-containing protein n=1 Tax=Seiridium unicorne TaxID=138068 RepID=A0ABR2V7P0_9PEZI
MEDTPDDSRKALLLSIYKHLDRGQFRLLQVLRKDTGLHCSLLKSNLEDNPDFVAISYTWGRAEEPEFMRDPDEQPTQSYFVFLEEQKWEVTPNLYHLLEEIVTDEQMDNRFLWIDALCINQSDDLEKGHQVNAMGRIYSQATCVYVWLGKGNADTRKVQEMVHQLAVIGNTHAEADGDIDFDKNRDIWDTEPGNPVHLARLGFPTPTTDDDWHALMAFFQRRWFFRVWTIQEIALSKRALIRCGKYTFDWDEMYRCSRVLARAPLGERVLLSAAARFGTYALSFGTVMSGLAIGLITGKAAEVANNTPNRTWLRAGNSPATVMNVLMLGTRVFGAVDPRDHLFAVLGLWGEFAQKHFGSELHLRADYRKPVRDVMTEVMVNLLAETGSLNFLSSVQPGDKTTDGLPSWVPDLSVACSQPIIVNMAQKMSLEKIDACRNAPQPLRTFKIEGKQLTMDTMLFATITDVGNGLQELAAGRFDETKSLLLAAAGQFPSSALMMGTFCSTLVFQDIEALPELPNSRFWSHFMALFIARVVGEIRAGSTRADSIARLDYLETLAGSPSDSPYIPTSQRVDAAGTRLGLWGEHGLEIDSEGVKAIFAEAGRLDSLLQKTLRRRRPFLTDSGQLGITSEGVRPGDTVRIVPDARAFFVFRNEPPFAVVGNIQRLIGEAYVHGAMCGEAFQALKSKGHVWETICVI